MGDRRAILYIKKFKVPAVQKIRYLPRNVQGEFRGYIPRACLYLGVRSLTCDGRRKCDIESEVNRHRYMSRMLMPFDSE